MPSIVVYIFCSLDYEVLLGSIFLFVKAGKSQ